LAERPAPRRQAVRNFPHVTGSARQPGAANRKKEAKDMSCVEGEDRVGGLMWGLALMLLGTVILLQYLDVVPFVAWRHWWPFIVVAMGIGQMVAARSPKRVGDGVGLALMGVWFYVASNHIWGMTWRNSWPLALVASGMGMVVRSIAAGFMRRGDDVREVKIDG
jgi:hypothetical protein